MNRTLVCVIGSVIFAFVGLGMAKTDYLNVIEPQLRSQLATGTGKVELRNADIGPGILKSIVSFPGLAQATELDLSDNPLFEDGAEVLARSEVLKGLRVLRLERCKLGYVGAKALSALLDLPKLEELHLAGNHLGDTGAAAMAYSSYLERLTLIDLSDNGIGDQGAKRFLESDHPTVRLLLGGNPKISKPVKEALRQRLGDRVSFVGSTE